MRSGHVEGAEVKLLGGHELFPKEPEGPWSAGRAATVCGELHGTWFMALTYAVKYNSVLVQPDLVMFQEKLKSKLLKISGEINETKRGLRKS